MTLREMQPVDYVRGERIEAAEINIVRQDLPKALDGSAGGTYDPTAALNIRSTTNGEGIGTADVTDALNLKSGATETVESGATLAVASGATFSISDAEVPNTIARTSRQVAASYHINGSAVAASTNFPLVEVVNKGGFSLSSNAVVVPTTGVYLVQFFTYAKNDSDATNPTLITLNVSDGATTICAGQNMRFSAVTGDGVLISGVGLVDITNTGTQSIRVRHASAGDTYTANAANGSRLVVARISDSI